jgi:hypothetical protein
LFAALQCWLKDLDGVVFDRPHLERLLGLERFRGTRVSWIQADFRKFFPYQEVYYHAGKQSFGSFYVSRRKLEGLLPDARCKMSDQERIKGVPTIALFEIWPRLDEKAFAAIGTAIPFFAEAANYDERLLASYLTLLIHGQISPRSIPPLHEEED